MNKKGFTLIEILAVIGIIGILGVVVSISLTKMLKNTQESECTDFVQEIEEGACTYASLTKDVDGKKVPVCDRNLGKCEIRVKELYEKGFIKDDKDKCCDKPLTESKIVTVTWDETTGEKTCTYNKAC